MSIVYSTEALLEDERLAAEADRSTAILEPALDDKSPRLLADVLRLAAKAYGDQPKIISRDERLSYAQIDLYSDRLASRLMKHGARSGDRVIIGLPNSAEFIVACFAVWKVRAVVVALDPCIRTGNLPDLLEKIEPVALIAESNFVERLCETTLPPSFRAFFIKGGISRPGLGPVAVENLRSAIEANIGTPRIPSGASPSDLATITFTSGSTGAPKGVMHTHETVLACVSFTQSYLRLSKRDAVMLPIPLHHVLAFRRFLTCFLVQCTLVLAPDIFIMKQFSETRPTGMVLVPSACNILIDHFASFLGKQSESLRYIEIGSESMSIERLHSLQMMLPATQIHLTYGLTEGRVGYLVRGPNGVFDRLDRLNHGLEIKVVDRDGRQVGVGQSGEILISGPGLFKGYWGDSLEVQAALKTRGFRTGDMGAVDENGRVRLMGRLDDMIKVGGHKIHPREIETVLQGHPSVAEVIVAKNSDGNGLESTLRAYVVRKRGHMVSDAELISHCREHLELYKVPASILFRQSFPKTSLGKTERRLVA